MTQDEFEAQFEDKYPGQPEIQDYMVEESVAIHKLFKAKAIRAHSTEVTIFWEAYSQSMDGSWLGASAEIMSEEVENFIDDPSSWWKHHPHNPN